MESVISAWVTDAFQEATGSSESRVERLDGRLVKIVLGADSDGRWPSPQNFMGSFMWEQYRVFFSPLLVEIVCVSARNKRTVVSAHSHLILSIDFVLGRAEVPTGRTGTVGNSKFN